MVRLLMTEIGVNERCRVEGAENGVEWCWLLYWKGTEKIVCMCGDVVVIEMKW